MKTENENDKDGRKARSEAWEIFQSIKELQIAAGQLATHPEVYTLRQYSWEGMLTIRFESDSYASDNGIAEFRRDDLVETLMDNLVRYKWRKRHKNVYWVAATEFGESGVAHCHILFTFLPLTQKGKEIPDISNFEDEARESLNHVCGLCNCPKSSVNLNWQPKFDDYGLASYVAKKEPGREDKHFLWSTDGINWILDDLDLLEVEDRLMVEKLESDKEVAQ